jgi:hypothetical protein
VFALAVGHWRLDEPLGMHPLEIVRELRAGITGAQRAMWLSSGAVAWANESTAIARAPDVGYCVTIGDACRYAADNRKLDEGEPEKMVVIDDSYLSRHAPVVRQRIAMAEVRLARLRNRALGDDRNHAAVAGYRGARFRRATTCSASSTSSTSSISPSEITSCWRPSVICPLRRSKNFRQSVKLFTVIWRSLG